MLCATKSVNLGMGQSDPDGCCSRGRVGWGAAVRAGSLRTGRFCWTLAAREEPGRWALAKHGLFKDEKAARLAAVEWAEVPGGDAGRTGAICLLRMFYFVGSTVGIHGKVLNRELAWSAVHLKKAILAALWMTLKEDWRRARMKQEEQVDAPSKWGRWGHQGNDLRAISGGKTL